MKTITSAQRYNTKMEKIFSEAKMLKEKNFKLATETLAYLIVTNQPFVISKHNHKMTIEWCERMIKNYCNENMPF